MPATIFKFSQDMDRLGLAYHYNDDEKSYDIYWSGQPVYNIHQSVVWRGWNDQVLEEVVTAVNMRKVFG
jgi:hypothetical protein